MSDLTGNILRAARLNAEIRAQGTVSASVQAEGGLRGTLNVSGKSGAITEETDPTVPAWAKAASKPAYTAGEVGAVPTTGGTMTGSLHLDTMNRNNPATIFVKQPLADNSDNRQIIIGITSADNAAVRLMSNNGGTELNRLNLAPTETTFKQPVAVGSGGTGVKSYADLYNKLKVYVVAEIENAADPAVEEALAILRGEVTQDVY